ncbi:hypothetical protein DL93DRAFT_687845 [Clavulina sp. PMI_390]|nr:hypothetical protein DL93DRAFT_687845 [Clavulina sp. PMI_390]
MLRQKRKENDSSRRLYISYHHRNPNPSDPSTLAYSIILADKNPHPDATTATRYRVAREEEPYDTNGLSEWAFQAQPDHSTRSIRPLSLMFLSKVAVEVTPVQIRDILAVVPVKPTDLVWDTAAWVTTAIAALQRAGLAPSQPDARTMLTIGAQFAREYGYRPGNLTVPTCNVIGEGIPSEVAKGQ